MTVIPDIVDTVWGLLNWRTAVGNVEGAPPVNAGKQGKHVSGNQNNIPSKLQWKPGKNGINETQDAWQHGTKLPDGTKVWDTGKYLKSMDVFALRWKKFRKKKKLL